jgi:hypothetical protein
VSPARRVAAFALRAVALYVVLLVAWIPIAGPARAVFEGASEFVLGVVMPGIEVDYLPLEQPTPGFDTRLAVTNRAAGLRRATPVSVRQIAWIPLCAVLALVVATPVPWSRRRRAALIAAGLALAFAVLRVGLKVLYEASDEGLGLVELGPGTRAVLEHAVHATFQSVVASVTVPVVIWVLATFRAGDLRRLLEGAPVEPAAG